MMHEITKQFAWKFEEYDHIEKSNRWLIAFAIVVIAGAAIAILLGNTMFAGVILIGGALLFYLSKRPPQELTLEISDRGIRYEEEMIPHEKINAFWITDPDNHGHTTLLLLIDRPFFALMSVPLPEGVDLITLRDYLRNFIEEQELREPWMYKLVDHLGI